MIGSPGRDQNRRDNGQFDFDDRGKIVAPPVADLVPHSDTMVASQAPVVGVEDAYESFKKTALSASPEASESVTPPPASDDSVEETPRSYSIRVSPENLDREWRRAEKIMQRAASKGLEGGWKAWKDTEVDEETGAVYDVIRWEGTPPKFDGWSFVAVVEKLPDGSPMTRMVPGYEGEMVDREWANEEKCDHCDTQRHRNKLIIVEKDGTRYRVGSSCVKDFLGWQYSPSDFEPPEEEEEGSRGSIAPSGYLTDTVLAKTVRVVKAFGWKSRGAAQEYGGEATADKVGALLVGRGELYEKVKKDLKAAEEWKESTEEDKEADLAFVREAQQWVESQPANNEYIANLQALAKQETVTSRNMSFLASLVGSYKRHLDAEKERAEEPQMAEELYAPVGKRITVPLKVERVFSFDTDFGVQHRHILSGENHRFQWKTGARELEEGEEYIVTGTVKELYDYRGKAYTVLTRCKVKED